MKKLNLKISPQNRMSKEYIKSLNLNKPKKEEKSVISLIEKKQSILFLYGVPLTFLDKNIHFMATIQHNIKKNTINIAGRLRFEETKNKTMMMGKKALKCTPENITALKEEIRNIHIKLERDLPFKSVKAHFELNFKIGESVDSIVQKMNDSNEFDIGQIENPNKNE